MVAANTPVFYLHPRERFCPCTVEWFLQHARLAVMRNVLLRRKVDRGGPLSAAHSPQRRRGRCQRNGAQQAAEQSSCSCTGPYPAVTQMPAGLPEGVGSQSIWKHLHFHIGQGMLVY